MVSVWTLNVNKQHRADPIRGWQWSWENILCAALWYNMQVDNHAQYHWKVIIKTKVSCLLWLMTLPISQTFWGRWKEGNCVIQKSIRVIPTEQTFSLYMASLWGHSSQCPWKQSKRSLDLIKKLANMILSFNNLKWPPRPLRLTASEWYPRSLPPHVDGQHLRSIKFVIVWCFHMQY